MSHKSFTRFRLIAIGIFIIGVVSAGFAYSLHRRNGPKLRQRKGFTLKTRDTNILFIPRLHPFPNEIASADTIRYQRSDGTFKQVRTYYHATGRVVKKEILFGIPGQGVFKIINSQGPLNFLSSMPPKEKTSYVPDSDGHWQPTFLKDDWVQGHQTYVLRFPDQDGGYLDMYCAPELDGYPIREVNVSPGGVSITEVVQITLGDPDDSVFGPLPNFLVDYDFFKQKIAVMEEAGKHETAQALQREMDEQIAKQMKE